MRPAPVLEPYGPTLPALLARRGLSLRARTAVIALLVAIAGGLALAYKLSGERQETEVINRTGVQFNFRYPADALPRLTPRPGELIRLEQRRRSGLFVQSFAVSPLTLPAYRGEPGGFLPAFADSVIRRLSVRYREFELVQEGKTRVNEAVAYNISWQARLLKRRLYGRTVLLPEQEPGARRGLILTLEATPAAGVPRALDVGIRGVVKRPYRTFRLGTERP